MKSKIIFPKQTNKEVFRFYFNFYWHLNKCNSFEIFFSQTNHIKNQSASQWSRLKYTLFRITIYVEIYQSSPYIIIHVVFLFIYLFQSRGIKQRMNPQNECVFYTKCVIPELYKSNWCVIGNTPSVSVKIRVKFINFHVLGSSFSRTILNS